MQFSVPVFVVPDGQGESGDTDRGRGEQVISPVPEPVPEDDPEKDDIQDAAAAIEVGDRVTAQSEIPDDPDYPAFAGDRRLRDDRSEQHERQQPVGAAQEQKPDLDRGEHPVAGEPDVQI
jgi:hypothetical protein